MTAKALKVSPALRAGINALLAEHGGLRLGKGVIIEEFNCVQSRTIERIVSGKEQCALLSIPQHAVIELKLSVPKVHRIVKKGRKCR